MFVADAPPLPCFALPTRLGSAAILSIYVATGAAAQPSQGGQAPLIGAVRVVDGDTFDLVRADASGSSVRVTRIRLEGVDACERGQTADLHGSIWPCGAIATNWLIEQTTGALVSCVPNQRDRWGRTIARCAARGRDLAAAGLTQGIYVAYRFKGQITNPEYGRLEEAARLGMRGIWATRFQMPWEWRRSQH